MQNQMGLSQIVLNLPQKILIPLGWKVGVKLHLKITPEDELCLP